MSFDRTGDSVTEFSVLLRTDSLERRVHVEYSTVVALDYPIPVAFICVSFKSLIIISYFQVLQKRPRRNHTDGLRSVILIRLIGSRKVNL